MERMETPYSSSSAYEDDDGYRTKIQTDRSNAIQWTGQRVDLRAFGRPFVSWGVAALIGAALCVLGWLYPEVRPDPFEDLPPPLSLAWWRFAPADPGIADLDMVPVGNFGGFLPRAVARRVPIELAQVADEQVRPDGKEILISLKASAQAAAFLYSGDGGLTWRAPDGRVPARCNAGQAIKIHSFQQGGQDIWSNCFPTPAVPGINQSRSQQVVPSGETAPPQTGDPWLTGDATTAIFFGESAPSSKVVPEGIWLRTAAPFVVFTGRGLSYPLEMPNEARPDVLLPLSGNRVVVASKEGFTTIAFGGDLVRDTTSNLSASRPEPQLDVKGSPLAFSAPTRIQDPAHVDASIRTLRISKDGNSVVVAQKVATHTGVLISHDAGRTWSRLAYVSGSAPWVVFIALPLAMLAAAAATRQLIRTPAGQPSIADEAATDRPIGLNDIDTLQFEPIARGLLMFIRNPRTEPPVTIAVTGQWGSGKTSLMTILKDLLFEYEARPVWFNAWHHQKEEHLLAALIENIRQQAIPSAGTWSGLFFRLRLLRRRLLGRVGVFLALLATVMVIIGAYLSVPAPITKQWQTSLVQFYEKTIEKKPAVQADGDAAIVKDSKPEAKADAKGGDDWLISLVALLPTGLAIPTLILGILRNLRPFPHANPEQLLGGDHNNRRSDIASKLSFRYRFEREFRETTEALRNSASPGLVIFIDDLDRCHAQNVVELLEAVNFIVSAGVCFVVLGIAKEQIRRSILANYKSEFLDIPKEALRDGNPEAARRRFADRYLEKLINIEVPIPQPSATQIEALLTGASNRIGPVSDRPSRWRLIYDNGPSVLAIALLFSLYVGLHSYLHSLGSLPLPAATFVANQPNDPPGSPLYPASLTIPQVYASDRDLAGVASRAGFPLAQTVMILLLLAAIGAYLGRLWVLAKRRPLSDSSAFRKALELWSGVIYLALRTPRAVKQYKNMLRYQAMRLRSLHASDVAASNIPEADLVALGAIALVNRSLLTGAIEGNGKSIESLVADATANSGAERPVFEEISRSLQKSASSGRIEEGITQYLKLLPSQTQDS
jgi:hypothetical protein